MSFWACLENVLWLANEAIMCSSVWVKRSILNNYMHLASQFQDSISLDIKATQVQTCANLD